MAEYKMDIATSIPHLTINDQVATANTIDISGDTVAFCRDEVMAYRDTLNMLKATCCVNQNGKVPPVEPKSEKARPSYRYIPGWLQVKRVVYHRPATIVFWEDGEKTVVKCREGDEFNEYAGFCAAVAKRVFGNNSRVVKIVKNADREAPKPEKAKGDISAESLKKIRDMIREGRKTDEIARELHIPLSKVRSVTVDIKNEQLKEQHRAIMELRAKHYSMAKISEKLGIPESTVRYVVKKERQFAKEKKKGEET